MQINAMCNEFYAFINIQSGRDRILSRLWVIQVSRYSLAKRDKID